MSVAAANIVTNHDREDKVGGVPSPEIAATQTQESHNNDNKVSKPSSNLEPSVNGTDLEKNTSSAESGDIEAAEFARREENVQNLARRLTSHSLASASGNRNPFQAAPNSALDPNGDHFDARQWTTAMLNLQLEDKDAAPTRTAGVCFNNLNVHGFGSSTDFQSSVGNVLFEGLGFARKLMGNKGTRIDILRNLEGVVEPGELLVVLGPPGSGCSTFLKTITGETHGFFVDKSSQLNYQGITPEVMNRNYRGEAIYTAEVDVHFPMMTVGETLYFAALARRPRHIPGGVSITQWAEHQRDVIMALYGITHTVNTHVGNDFIRGVSGGERKRVTIAEASLSRATLQSWDNSTRGLDSANAIEFCKTLRMETEILGTTACVAIYQAPQAAYDLFDKALVLYEGRQIFFGPTREAKAYFVEMGFDCPDRQTDADFLTSMTSPLERIVRPGWENRVPRTPDEFAQRWKDSTERAALVQQIEAYNQKYPFGGEHSQKFKDSRKIQKAKAQRERSPYTLSYSQQVKLCLQRGFWRLKADPTITITQLVANSMMALIISSVFYNLPATSESFFLRSALLFFAILMNAFASALEILILYAQRPIVEKHSRYALYHPSAEAFASMLVDVPYKILNCIMFNLVLYFMTNLRREPGNFFFFLLISFTLTLVMSMFFRSIAALSRSLVQALAPAAILILGLVMYTGFAVPPTYIKAWAKWIRYINPVSYGFESLMINEFHNREFVCNQYVPSGSGYENASGTEHACSAVGSVPGQATVNGDRYIESAYNYNADHKWRNFGILFVFMFGLMLVYLTATEYITAKKSKGEVLVFRRGYGAKNESSDDVESAPAGRSVAVQKVQSADIDIIERQTAIFQWKDVCYDIKIKKEQRRILDHVDGWVKPGTLTALMGVSGAGKTTLLDCLASRATVGVISGELLVDGKLRDDSFQRKTGYAQQQDLHLSTTTVREALRFSALLRQPAHVSRQEKLDYVEEVIKLLEMTEYAEAIVGVPGEGLNVEQRKRLTIGVELAAKPALLLFLDEPTSGLDSQTSWAILDLLDRLKKNGQAILCTIHQPSAMLFQRFDRLLFLAPGGKTVYFGHIGKSAETLIDYFVRSGAKPCPPAANPAEWILEITGGAPGSHTDIDWYQTWRDSPEYEEVQRHLAELKTERSQMEALQRTLSAQKREDKAAYREFAAPFWEQARETIVRVFQQYWRTPSYVYSKIFLCVLSALFIGFSLYQMPNTQQGLQNQMFGIFMLFTIFGQLTQQIMPHFVTQRSLFEVRERPSKAYSWKAFMLANILVELFYNSLMAIFIYFCLYYPIGLYHNAEPTDAVHLRGFQFFLFVWMFMVFTSTFTHMIIAGIDSAEAAGGLGNMLFSLCLIFCGILSQSFPRFWIFLYRLSPFTYLTSALLAAGLANSKVECAQREFVVFNPPSGQTCNQYVSTYSKNFGGYVNNPSATENCQFCTLSDTNVFLHGLKADYSLLWRNFGILWAYVIFNILAALAFYWLARMPRQKKEKEEENDKKEKGKQDDGAESQPGGESSRVESRMDDHEQKEIEGSRGVSAVGTATPPRQEKEVQEKEVGEKKL